MKPHRPRVVTPDTIICGDCLEVMAGMPDGCVDAIVTDPPAGIGFMGKAWDHDKGGRDQWIAWMATVAAEARRVCKPGAHALVWSLPRTSHWTATAWENAGWEPRDRIGHLFGSGFPKSLDVSKAIDKAAGAQREAEAAAKWSGWGTALKPAVEDWWLLRKPLSGTVAANVLEHGTGALNVDGCRVETADSWDAFEHPNSTDGVTWGGELNTSSSSHPLGRWPANIVHDGSDEVLAVFPSETGNGYRPHESAQTGAFFGSIDSTQGPRGHDDSGSAARFFYCAKATTRERDMSVGGAVVSPSEMTGRAEGSPGLANPRASSTSARRNHHPTVKPLALMRWLVRLVAPMGAVVLDPFAGSGTTGKAAIAEGCRFILIEKDADYCAIAEQRLAQRSLLSEIDP